MASIRRRGGKWQVQVCIGGVRRSATFGTKRAAASWAASQVLEVEAVRSGSVLDVPLSDLFDRYANEVSPKKRGVKWEKNRLAWFCRDKIALIRLPRLTSSDFAAWRDRRLSEVMSSTVLRDWSLLSNVFTVAVREWRVLKENPLVGLRRPDDSLPRDRRISEDEIDRLLYCFNYHRDQKCLTVSARVAAVFLFAIETAMRAGEISGLRWSHVSGPVAYLPFVKNGFPRHVPLSQAALSILSRLPREGGDSVFNLNVSQIDSNFRRVRDEALIENLHFHDTRHEAMTRLAQRLHVLDLARMVGVRDLRTLMVYYNATPSDIAARLG
jgi:integrase